MVSGGKNKYWYQLCNLASFKKKFVGCSFAVLFKLFVGIKVFTYVSAYL